MVDGGAARTDVAGALPTGNGVSLELNRVQLPTLPPCCRPSTSGRRIHGLHRRHGYRAARVFSDDELLAASDSVFGLLDNPADMGRSELLATYDDIGLEISRRAAGREPEPA